jgi:hypothetical protein
VNIPPIDEIMDAVGDGEDDSDVRDPEFGLNAILRAGALRW